MSGGNGHLDETVDLDALPSLASGWAWVIAADICQVIASGSTPKADKMYAAGHGEVPFIKVYNLTHEGLLDFSVRPTFIDRETHQGLLRRSRALPEDVLINIVGPPLGKVSIVPDDFPEWNINQAVVLFRTNKGFHYKYLAYTLLTESVMRRVTARAKATAGQYNIGVNMCRKLLPIPVAPFSEQHGIVEAIESYLTRLDDAVASLERVQRNLKRYRASVLKAAVEGRLVPTEADIALSEGRDYEPASVLLERILKERRQRWVDDAAEKGRAKAEEKAKKASKPWMTKDNAKALNAERDKAAKKYKEPAAPATDDLPELPEGWCWTSADQIGLVSGGLTKNSKRSTLPRQVPYLRVANVYSDELRLEEIKTIGVTDTEMDRVLLQLNDLLVVEGNGSIEQIGRVALWDGSIHGCTHQNHLIKVRLVDTELSRWCLQWLLSPSGRSAIVCQASSTSGLHTLSISKVAGLAVPLAPMLEAICISQEVDRLLTLAAVSDVTASVSIRRCQRLRQSILKWAFEGKLVDQDPSDEPASVLLEHIQAERAAVEATNTKKNGRKAGRLRKKK